MNSPQSWPNSSISSPSLPGSNHESPLVSLTARQLKAKRRASAIPCPTRLIRLTNLPLAFESYRLASRREPSCLITSIRDAFATSSPTLEDCVCHSTTGRATRGVGGSLQLGVLKKRHPIPLTFV